MRFVTKLQINIPKIRQDFELGDLTVLIGRSNSGKTRILDNIFTRMNHLYQNYDVLAQSIPPKQCVQVYSADNIFVPNELSQKIEISFVKGYRPSRGNIAGLSTSVARFARSAQKIDPHLRDVGSSEIELDSGERRLLVEQGSGFQNMGHIFEALTSRINLLLIDEPEVSQFPQGKLELLCAILEQCGTKQIVIATHDPTLINQYLIRKISPGSNVKVYSYCESRFDLVDFSNCDPEIHIGYLSQTYSGKPVHLVVEGQTEYYAFQALLHRFAQKNSIPHYPKFVNKISLSYLAGSQWKINKVHLPDPRYYDVLVLLDGEHRTDNSALGENSILIDNVKNFKPGKVNWLFLTEQNIEQAFSTVFGEVSRDKPTGLALQIWGMPELKLPSQIQEILSWAYFHTGAPIHFNGPHEGWYPNDIT